MKEQKIRQCTVNIVRLTSAEMQNYIQQQPKSNSSTSPIQTSPAESIQTSPQTHAPKVHNLRQRSIKSTNPSQPTQSIKKTKPKNAIVKMNVPCPIKLWKTLKNSRSAIPPKNSIIVAKMRSFSPWPAKLVGLHNKTALVYFFGTGEHGEVKSDEIILFEDALLLLKALSLKKLKNYHRAIREAEIFLSIPTDASILNHFFSM